MKVKILSLICAIVVFGAFLIGDFIYLSSATNSINKKYEKITEEVKDDDKDKDKDKTEEKPTEDKTDDIIGDDRTEAVTEPTEEPTEPTESTDPSVPKTEPTVDPEDETLVSVITETPTEPTNPTQPTNPTNPTQPTTPTNPTQPTTPKYYTLTYNANGGSVSPASKSLMNGVPYGTLPTPTRSGYTFDGWYTKASGGTKVSSSTKINGNTTIYAHWTKNGGSGTNPTNPTYYTLTYNPNGGTVNPTSKTIAKGTAYGTLPTPTRAGYTFNGWYTKASGGTKVSASTKISGNTTIYAHWTKVATPTNPTSPTQPTQPTNSTMEPSPYNSYFSNALTSWEWSMFNAINEKRQENGLNPVTMAAELRYTAEETANMYLTHNNDYIRSYLTGYGFRAFKENGVNQTNGYEYFNRKLLSDTSCKLFTSTAYRYVGIGIVHTITHTGETLDAVVVIYK